MTQHSARSTQHSWLAAARWLMLVLGLLAWAPGGGAQGTGWERDGLAGRKVRALAISPDGRGLAGLTLGSSEPSPLWVRDSRGWAQPASEAPGYILTLAHLPEGGLLLGTGRDIAEQPGLFWVGGSPPTTRRLYDVQAIGALAVVPGRGGSDIFAATAPYGDRDASAALLQRDAATGSWSVVLEGSLACGEMPPYFKQIAPAPSEPTTLFALEECVASVVRQTQLWRSDDRGQTWRTLPRRGAAFPLSGVLGVDPSDPDVLYLAGSTQAAQPAAGLERSLDSGQTWAVLGETSPGLTGVRALAIDPRDPRRVLAGTDRHGVFASDDRGATWSELAGLEGLRTWALAVDRPRGMLYAATSDGVWKMPLP